MDISVEGGAIVPQARWMQFPGSDEIKAGYALCAEADHTDATLDDFQLNAARGSRAEKPNFNNMPYFLGFAVEGFKPYSSPPHVPIVPHDQFLNLAQVWTDQSIAAGDMLAPAPGTYAFQKAAAAKPVFIALQTVDRSSTAGLVYGMWAPMIDAAAIGRKIKTIELSGLAAGYGATSQFSETADAGDWLVTVVDAGSDNGETIVASDTENAIVFTTNDADNDGLNIQHNGEPFSFASGTSCYFGIDVKANDASTLDWFFGLAISDTTVLAATTDRAGFSVPAGDSSQAIKYLCEKNSTETNGETGTTMADDTWYRLEMYHDGSGNVRFAVDGEIVATVTTNVPDDERMSPTLAIRNASAAASVVSVRNMVCRQHV